MGGSFNPVHFGHLMLADYMAQFTGMDEVWLMLSPLNPLKEGVASMVSDSDRLAMLDIAVRSTSGVKVCDIELEMPRPSYSIDSLRELKRRYPCFRFSLIVGSDNWLIFDKWKDYRSIISEFTPVIYPRPGYAVDACSLPSGVTLVKAPVIEISSTFIREAINQGHDMNNFLPSGVWEYIVSHHLYQKL